MSKANSKTIEQLIDDDYYGYAKYVIESRAIPSYIDGFKPVQRKVLYVVRKTAPVNGPKKKISEIAGSMSSMANYHHGSASAEDASSRMAQTFNNNVPLVTGHGSFGSRLVPEPSAPRYIFGTLSPEFDKWFSDEEVCPPNPEPDSPEPAHYLPLIPWVLVNGSSGMAVGFATNILPHAPADIAKLCHDCLRSSDGSLDSNMIVKPSFPAFHGEIVQRDDAGKSWTTRGLIRKKNTTNLVITELPVGYSREKYVKILTKMEDDDRINNFEDHCSKKGFEFRISVSRKQMQWFESGKKSLEEHFKLETHFTENLTAIDENNKLVVFDSIPEMVQRFCEYRKKMFTKKFAHEAQEASERLTYLRAQRTFIHNVVTGVIEVSKNTRKQLLKHVMQDIIKDEDKANRIISIPVYNMTSDRIKTLEKQIRDEESNLEYWKTVDVNDHYLEHLEKVM